MATRSTLEKRISDVGSNLARTLGDVLDAIPGAPHRPQFLARALGVNTVLTSRLLKAAQQPDPIAVAHMIPGPEPLRRLLRAAAKKKIDPSLIREASAAVDRFEQLIDAEAGDRSALDAIISGFLPDAREKVELIAKQSVFRGISQLLGCACDVQHCTTMLYPSDEATKRRRDEGNGSPSLADALCLFVSQGLRRVRPGLAVEYASVHSTTPMFTIAGEPLEDLHGLLLEEFCSHPLPRMQVTRYDDFAQYTLSGDDVGVRSAVDLVHATYLPRKKEIDRASDEPPRKATVSIGIGTPVRTSIFDLLLHEDIYPNQDPTLNIYRTAGVFEKSRQRTEHSVLSTQHSAPSTQHSSLDRLEVIESIQALGSGLGRFRSAETRGYQDMIRRICEQRDWDATKLRGYRCRIEYPIYSSEIVMAFDVPVRG